MVGLRQIIRPPYYSNQSCIHGSENDHLFCISIYTLSICPPIQNRTTSSLTPNPAVKPTNHGKARCRFAELLLDDGMRSSAWGNEPPDGTSSRRSWSEFSSEKWKVLFTMRPFPTWGMKRVLGLKQELSLPWSSLLSKIPFMAALFSTFVVEFISAQCNTTI